MEVLEQILEALVQEQVVVDLVLPLVLNHLLLQISITMHLEIAMRPQHQQLMQIHLEIPQEVQVLPFKVLSKQLLLPKHTPQWTN